MKLFLKYSPFLDALSGSRETLKSWIIKSQENELESAEDFNSYVDMMLNSNLEQEIAVADIDSTFAGGTANISDSNWINIIYVECGYMM